MKTAAELSKLSMQMGNLAIVIKPGEDDPFRDSRKLIQYHLQTAASLTLQIAEATAEREKR